MRFAYSSTSYSFMHVQQERFPQVCVGCEKVRVTDTEKILTVQYLITLMYVIL
jgi:hypothetical protein